MIMVLQLCLMVVLGYIFLQDARSRSIYLWCFPLLLTLFIVLRWLNNESWMVIMADGLKCLIFLTMQLGILTIYFSAKNRRWTNITRGILGWGDVLFLICTACYLSLFNFVGFYLVSLFLSLITWLSWQTIRKNTVAIKVPLAGLQAFFLLVFLIVDWLSPVVSLTQDDWITRWILI
ncbi:hypothetical protein LJ707_10445 [Mucilaginibacter sp. UR6-1]|uniref:hypothetical protein n=1 Tax=Mucilaginibacter sp. UR6-1 TaxID=1435643 RepID=UPI001E4C54EB|nr:hypothetical protein [Mucilaginibacter sp. UR6-1]MCC8409352.1 hypothetical protein [Mucilaginibacter sp. UR6-1]